MNDLCFAFRQLRQNPSFTAVAVVTLALGIGANTAIFSVVNAVLLRPLPYPDPGRLVQVFRQAGSPQSAKLTDWLGGRELETLQQENRVLSHLAAYTVGQVNLTGVEEAQRLRGGLVSASFLPMLGVQPALGRGFLPEDDRPGAAPVAVLSHAAWQRLFQGHTNILGRSVTLDRRAFTVVGILPTSFRFVEDFDVCVSLAANEQSKIEGLQLYRKAVGRLKPSISLTQAQAELDGIYQGVRDAKDDSCLVLAHFQGEIVREVKLKLLVFLGAVGFVLLIACANVANLLLVRAGVRRKEMAVRTALGAGRGRLIRQLLTESMLLALLGAAGGLVLAQWMISALDAFTSSLPNLQPVHVDGWVLGFTLLAAVAAGALAGLAPAMVTSQLNLTEDLKAGANSLSGGRRAHRLRGSLVVVEVALAVVLLWGAGLLARSFLQLQAVDPGYQPERLLTFTLDADQARYPRARARSDYFERVIGRLGGLSGVETVGASTAMPLTGFSMASTALIEGRPQSQPDSIVTCAVVNGDYFRALGIPLRSGRVFTDLDRQGAPEVAVVNEGFVRRHFPNEAALGKRILVFINPENMEWKTVIGVVADAKLHSLEQDAPPQVYLSYLQAGMASMSLAVRAEDNPLALAGAVRGVLREVDKDQPIWNLMTMEQRMADTVASRRLNMLLLGSFAALALVLASLGIYAVVSCSVSQQTHEIGVRMALGAQRTDVEGAVVSQGMRLVLVGGLVGMALAYGLTRIMSALLYQVQPGDPATAGVVTALLIGVSVAACRLPARRAAKVDPVVALRCE